MKANRTHALVIRDALDQWNRSGLLDDRTTALLRQDIEPVPFDWKKLAKYSFWIALICIVTAISSVLLDRVLMALLERIFNAPDIIKSLGFAALSALFYGVGVKSRRKYPAKVFSNEAVLFLGVLATAGSIFELGRAIDTGSGHFSILILLGCIVYGVLGYQFKSNLIWLFSLVSLGSWMGTETGYASGWGAYYLGMNYPLRFVLFGLALSVFALWAERLKGFERFSRTTLIVGLLYGFIALWIMSIFGNYGDHASWALIKQSSLFLWSVVFGLAAVAAIYHGLRLDSGVTKGFGITFLFINLYTRFFEYFWEPTHKAIFFALLGVSFWYLGSRAEKIWNVTRLVQQ